MAQQRHNSAHVHGDGSFQLLVFLQIPRSTTSPYKAFRDALGDEAVGWVGRNLKEADLDDPELLASFKVVGGRIPLSRAVTFEKATTFATIVNDPVARSLGQWNDAIGDVNHPHHEATHTFMLRELFEEKHPFADAMANVATQFLLNAADADCTAEAALEAVRSHRCVIGEASNPKAFAIMVARRLGLEPGTLNEASFRAPPHHPQAARGELLRLIREANAQDIALIEGLRGMMEEKRPVVRTTGGRPNRGERADRPQRGERAKRPDRPNQPKRRRAKSTDPEPQG